MEFKKYYLLSAASIIILMIACAKKSNAHLNEAPSSVSNLAAEMAFKELDTMKSYFCDYPEECEHYKNSTFLEKRRFEDRVYLKRMHLAENFLDSFPDEPRYFKVLKFFFNLNFEPYFVPNDISDSLTIFLSQRYKSNTQPFLQQMRALPVDTVARNEWIGKGHNFISKFLKSNATVDQKAEIEMAQLWRDFRKALFIYQNFDKPNKGFESAFWQRFDSQFWEAFRLRMEGLIEKYSELETMAIYVELLISSITKFSPHLAEPYWEGFLRATDLGHPLAGNIGFRAIHEKAKINLKALREVDLSKPLEMVFTAMDGTEINLTDMRGKVVLIDFWTIQCAPCIKEMPYVQALYDKYRSLGFEVIGLVGNGDESKERVLEIIKQQGATWPQSLDKGKNVVVSYHSLFNIKLYPTVWLLNKKGEIVDKRARGERLEPLIRQELGLDD